MLSAPFPIGGEAIFSMARKDPDKYLGRWNATAFRQLSLPWGVASLRTLLREGVDPHSPHIHQQIADWCGRYYVFLEEGDLGESTAATIALDVDAQWDLYLVNSSRLAILGNRGSGGLA